MPSTRGAYYDVFSDRKGDVLAGATVTFTGAAGGAVYATSSGGSALTSVTTDANGALNVYPEADRYTIVATLSGYDPVTKYVTIVGLQDDGTIGLDQLPINFGSIPPTTGRVTVVLDNDPRLGSRGQWTPNTFYRAKDRVIYNLRFYEAQVDLLSGATFDVFTPTAEG
jgi:hypothetical protein